MANILDRWIERVIYAVETDSSEQFADALYFGQTAFGAETVETIVFTQIPLKLSTEHIVRMHKFAVSSEDHQKFIHAILTRLTKEMTKFGLELGVDFSYVKDGDLSCITMSKSTALEVESSCNQGVWRHLLPYLRIR
jgi:hypothetical protein